jgi:hypothetical protein
MIKMLMTNIREFVTRVLQISHELDHLISVNQSAFIRKRCIHDNFVYA